MEKKSNRALWVGLGLLALAAALQLVAAGFPPYGDGIRAFGHLTSALLGQVFGVLPFPLSEWIMLLLVPALVTLAVLWVRRRGWRDGLRRFAGLLTLLAGIAALLFVLNLGVQYLAPAYADRAGLKPRTFTAAELAEMTEYLLGKANAAADRVPRGADGACDFGPYAAMSRRVSEAYQGMAQGLFQRRNPFESRLIWPARPKQSLLLGKAMSFLGITGYYFPWTGEAVVSRDWVDAMLPFTIAHEMAHAYGIGPEDEANMTAFLACVETSASGTDPAHAYSTWFAAYRYASSALYRADPTRWAELFEQRGALLSADLAELDAYLTRYDTPVRDLGTAVNDTYIKATGQPEGADTYGRVVDLLLAWFYDTALP